MFRTVISDVSVTELAIPLAPKGELSPNQDRGGHTDNKT